jgi:ketosteroid isomerase-like protein
LTFTALQLTLVIFIRWTIKLRGGQVNGREDFIEAAVRRENLAEQAFYLGDPEPFKAMWSNTDDVSLFGAFGPCKRGWAELSRTFDWVASRYRDGKVSSEYMVAYEGTDLAYTVGYEQGEVYLDGGAARKMTLRVTQIYRLEDGEWRLVHRHGDFAPIDESAPLPDAPKSDEAERLS